MSDHQDTPPASAGSRGTPPPPEGDPVVPVAPAAPGPSGPATGEVPLVDAAPAASAATAPQPDAAVMSEDAVVALIAERDEYLEALQRLKADFANFRRRNDEQAANVREQAAADLVNRLLPVLDSAEAALGQGVEEVRPLATALVEVLNGQGLQRLDPVGEPFDPEHHEAVMFEPGDGDVQVVVETMRLGYVWNGRVLRAAMVKVRG